MKYLLALLLFSACDHALPSAAPDAARVSDQGPPADSSTTDATCSPDGPEHCGVDLEMMCADFEQPCTERPCCAGAVILKCCSDSLCQVNCP